MNGRGVYNLQELVLEGYTEQDFMSYQSNIMSNLWRLSAMMRSIIHARA